MSHSTADPAHLRDRKDLVCTAARWSWNGSRAAPASSRSFRPRGRPDRRLRVWRHLRHRPPPATGSPGDPDAAGPGTRGARQRVPTRRGNYGKTPTGYRSPWAMPSCGPCPFLRHLRPMPDAPGANLLRRPQDLGGNRHQRGAGAVRIVGRDHRPAEGHHRREAARGVARWPPWPSPAPGPRSCMPSTMPPDTPGRTVVVQGSGPVGLAAAALAELAGAAPIAPRGPSGQAGAGSGGRDRRPARQPGGVRGPGRNPRRP